MLEMVISDDRATGLGQGICSLLANYSDNSRLGRAQALNFFDQDDFFDGVSNGLLSCHEVNARQGNLGCHSTFYSHSLISLPVRPGAKSPLVVQSICACWPLVTQRCTPRLEGNQG